MALTKERKQEIIEQFRIHEADTGSPEVQIAILTERIKDLTEHYLEPRRTIQASTSSVIPKIFYWESKYFKNHGPLIEAFRGRPCLKIAVTRRWESRGLWVL